MKVVDAATAPSMSLEKVTVCGLYTRQKYSDHIIHMHILYIYISESGMRYRTNDDSTAGMRPRRPFPDFPHRDTGTCTRPRVIFGTVTRAGAGPDTTRCNFRIDTVPTRAMSGMRR